MILERLILGLLVAAPMTGYDVKKYVDSTVRHFWAADKAQVYRALASLVSKGWATVTVIPQEGRPARLEHHITDDGRQALRDWLVSPLPDHADRDPFLARLFFAGELDREEVLELLDQRRAQVTALLDALTATTPAPPGDLAGRLRNATLENGLAHARTELAWLDDTERNLP